MSDINKVIIRGRADNSCQEWNEKAICRCGCQEGKLMRRFVPNLGASMARGRPVGEIRMNWLAPDWLSMDTQAIIDGHVSGDFDPAEKVLRPWANVEHRIGDRVVNAEEFERSCIEDEEKKKAELKRHMYESANAIMHYINKEGGMRKVQDICGTPFGSLVAYVLDGEAL